MGPPCADTRPAIIEENGRVSDRRSTIFYMYHLRYVQVNTTVALEFVDAEMPLLAAGPATGRMAKVRQRFP